MRAFEAKQATDKIVADLKYGMFISDIKKEAKEYGKYSISYFLDDLHDLGIFEGALKLISARLKEDGFYTEIVLEISDFLKKFIIEWDLAEKPFTIALEAKELADQKVADLNYKKLNEEFSHLANYIETNKATYHTDDLYDNGIEAKQASDKIVADLKFGMFISDIKKEAKENGKYSIGYFLDDLHDLGIYEGALNLISARLVEEGFHTEIVLEISDFLKEFIIEWDLAEKQFSLALEAKEIADQKMADLNYEKLNEEVSHLANNTETYEAKYHIDDLYENGIKPGALKKIALMFCKDGYDTMVDYSTNCFTISWKHVRDDDFMGMPTFIE